MSTRVLVLLGTILDIGCSSRAPDSTTVASKPAPEAGRVHVIPADAPMVPDAAESSDQLRVKTLEQELDRGTTSEQLTRLDAMDRTTLVSLVRSGTCYRAILAANILDRRGDPTYLPHRGTTNDPDTLARLLCLIAAIPNEYEPDAIPLQRVDLLRELFPPRGKVSSANEVCPGDDDRMPDGGTIKESFSRGTASGDELDHRFDNVGSGACQPGIWNAREVAGSFHCTGSGSAYGTVVTLSPDPDGRLYVRAISYQRALGCH